MPDLSGPAREVDASLAGPAIVYGSEPADARDLDLLLLHPDPELEQRLREEGWRRSGERWIRVSGTRVVALDIDVVGASEDWAGISEDQLRDLFSAAIPLPGYRRLYRPAPRHQLLLLARLVTTDPGEIRAKRLQRARRALTEDPGAFLAAEAIAASWSARRRLRVLRSALDGGGRVSALEALTARAEQARVRGLAAPGAYARAAASLLARPGPALTVALSGVDGAGKSSQGRALVEALNALGQDASLEWERFTTQDAVTHVAEPVKRLLHGIRGAAPYRSPADVDAGRAEAPTAATSDLGHLLRERSAAVNAAWLLFLATVHMSALRHRNRRHVRAARSVVHDRYLLDAIVQLREQYGDGVSTSLAERLMRALTPRADIAAFLDVPGKEAFRRKQDYSAEELERHRARYLATAEELGISVVDGTADSDAVFEVLLDAVLAALAAPGSASRRLPLRRPGRRSASAIVAGIGSATDHV